MSHTIDERIVSMKFDNKQFENGVGTSLKTLSKLKEGLNLSGAAKGLNDINEASRKVSFAGMANGIEAVRVKFSALQVMAITTLANITNSIVNTGRRLVSAFTIDPIKDGFREYETQMNAIQTIMANTASKGTTLKDVNAALQELNVYADKTIYNFTEMTRNIGTFTAAGVDLKTSTAAIKGIANLAAVSGSNSQQASAAMYQLSQALASGTVKLQDWNSVVNAGMGGQVFQDALKETARVHGVKIDQMIKKEGSFRETLKNEWLTSKILTETLSKFTGDLNEKQLKSMGYTDKQVKEIIKLGKMANEAATKVKTFTQLMDTLKEAVGSGWAQTWQIVFGGFEEAKEMFTSVSDTLGAMINESAESRNKMLQGWKDLGGRTALIDSIKNAFNGLMGILKSVHGAFRDIFPQTTSKQLYNFTVGLKNLTAHFKMSDENLKNLRSTFKGVFAILDIGKTILLALCRAIGITMEGVGDFLSIILRITASIGEWVASVDQAIKQSGVFNKVLSKIAYTIRTIMGGVSYALNVIIGGIGVLITKLSENINIPGLELIHEFLGTLGRRMSYIGDEASTMAITVGGAFVKMGQSITKSRVGKLVTSIWDLVKKVAKAVSVLLDRTIDSITVSLQNADFSVILDAIAGISIGGMLLAFKKFMKSLSETVEKSKGFFANIKSILDNVRNSLEAYQQNLKAKTLLKIATAIALLAASIVAISLIDSGKLVSSLAAIGTLFTQLLVAMKIYTKIGDNKTKMLKANAVMISMSIAILILSSAMKKMAELDWNGIAKGSVGITVLASILVAAAKILSKEKKTVIKGAGAMVVFALAIKILASACIALSKIKMDKLKVGLVGVGILMAEISLFLNNTKFTSKSMTTAIGITILAGALKILVSVCSDFAKMGSDDIYKGLKSIGGLLAELAIFTNVTGKAKHVMSTGIALVAIGAAMKILASALKDFGDMGWNDIVKGLKAMGIALAEITVAMNLLPKNLPIAATGLVIVGAALKIIASAMKDFGGMSWEDIKAGLVALGGALLILTIALHAMKGTIAGSAALVIAAAALAMLVPTLTILGAMTWDSIIRGLVALAGAIGVFGLAAFILTPIIPAMLGLAGAFVLLGVAMLGIGAGLALVGLGLSGVATGFALLAGVTATGAAAIVTALSIIIVGVAALIPAILEKIAEGIVAFCKVFTDSIPAILECISAILKAIIDCIVINTPIILEGVFKILSSILDALINWTPIIVQKVVNLMIAFLKVISDNIPKIINAAVDIIIAFVKGIASNLKRIIDSAFKLIITFINGLADAIRNNAGAIADACVNLVSAIVEGIGKMGGRFVKAGANAVKGFIKGLLSIPGEIWKAGKAIGSKALSAAKNALNIHSPSRKFAELGKYSALGFADGLSKFSDDAAYEAKNMGTSAISSLKNTISNISDIVMGNVDASPTIRPVLDLTDISNGSKSIGSLINQSGNIDITTSNLKASALSKSIDSANQNGNKLDIVFDKISSLSKSISKLEEVLNTEQPVYITNAIQLDTREIARETIPLVSNGLALNIRRGR